MDNDFKGFEPVSEDLLETTVDSSFKDGQRMERESHTYTSVDRNFFSPGYSGYVDSLVPVNGKSAWESIQEIAKRKRVVKVYDLGCGSGNALISLQERGDEEGIAIDGLGIAATRERNFGSRENLHQVDTNEYNADAKKYKCKGIRSRNMKHNKAEQRKYKGIHSRCK